MYNRKPDWLKKRISPDTKKINEVKSLILDLNLNTVCQSAKCPNIFECFGNRTATFMLMGNICTRNCGYCGIESGKPEKPVEEEPSKVAGAVRRMGLKHVIITSVTRDDIADGGAYCFAETIKELKKLDMDLKIECLVPDFRGSISSLKIILEQNPDVLGHNIETIKRNFKKLKKASSYKNSLNILRHAKILKPGIFTKSGFMLGLGEKKEEIIELLKDLRKVDCDILTIGQYLRPAGMNVQVRKYYTEKEFEEIGKLAAGFGFKAVVSGIFTRSSYNAAAILDDILSEGKRKIVS